MDRGPLRGSGPLPGERVENSPKDGAYEADRVIDRLSCFGFRRSAWMHVECGACGARYVIADEKIPAQGVRVRCRKCQAVFSVAKPEPVAPAELPLIPPSPLEAPREGGAPAAAPERGTDIERFAPSFAEHPPAAGVEISSQPEFTRGYESGVSSPAPAPGAPPVRELSAPAPSAPARPHSTGPAAEPNPFASEPKLDASEPNAPGPKPSAERSPASTGIPEGLPEAERLKHERARRLARVLASDIAIYNKEKRDRGIKDGNLVAVLGYEIKKSWEVYKERVTAELANSTPYFRDALNEMLAEGKKIF
ncbi:MAG: hypothetical protein E6K76_03075 [Candidatus Eisenbacteria bacterium]|uniref:Zinc finger/thioredoxin putative domain-containing protein n=1 Tax=Eiseniibacteriota bacterium TaxID=2212470 RepID=A0A538T8F1_UNCEI|nr:MAG: hypothetical protein E6K76_03075 [Candidatus Eisenbacteria bacterium]